MYMNTLLQKEQHEMIIANTIIIIVFPYSKGIIKNEPLSIEKI